MFFLLAVPCGSLVTTREVDAMDSKNLRIMLEVSLMVGGAAALLSFF